MQRTGFEPAQRTTIFKGFGTNSSLRLRFAFFVLMTRLELATSLVISKGILTYELHQLYTSFITCYF